MAQNIYHPVESEDIINAQALKIVENVLHACIDEKISDRSTDLQQVLLQCPKQRTSLYTGMPLRIIESVSEKPPNDLEIDLSLHLAICKTLKKFYSKEEEPTCRQLYNMLKAQTITDHKNLTKLSADFAGFTCQLVQLGYETVKTIDGGQIIMENPKYTFERNRYLKKITKARTLKNKIYYLSIRIYDESKKCMVPINGNFLNKPSEWNVLTLYHLISKDGCENLIFCYNYDTNNLTKWILQIVIPLLKASSLIVIDNNYVFDLPGKQYISEYHPKKDMIKWLKNHNLPCTPSMSKAELFELIEKCSVKLGNNTLENIFQAFGHDVLCVPKQIHNLAPTQLVWQNVNNVYKSQLLQNSMKSTSSKIEANIAVKDSICDLISLLDSNIYQKYDQAIKKAEEEFIALDAEIEIYLDKYKLDFESIVPDGDKKWSNTDMLL